MTSKPGDLEARGLPGESIKFAGAEARVEEEQLNKYTFGHIFERTESWSGGFSIQFPNR